MAVPPRTIGEHEGAVWSLAVLSDGRLATGSEDRTVRIWDVESGKQLQVLEGHERAVWSLVVLSDGRLATGSEDRTVRIWDVESGKQLQVLGGHGGPIFALAVLSDGRLATGSEDRTVRIWDVESGKELQVLGGHGGPIFALAVLSDGRLATGSEDRTVRIWDVESGKQLQVLEGHERAVWSLVVLSDGRLATGSEDRTVRIWDVESGKQLQVLGGHGGPIFALAVLSDGRLATGSEDRTVRIWDVESGKELQVLGGHGGPIFALAVLSDGRLATGSEDRTVRIWVKTGEGGASVAGRQRKPRSVVTRTGDRGETGMLYGGRVPKTDPRVEAYGTVDESVSALGLARALCAKPTVKEILLEVQKELFLVGGELATSSAQYEKLKENFQVVTTQMVERLDKLIEELEQEIEVPRTFLVPGATPGAAALDLGRTIIRRAERRAVGLNQAGVLPNPEVLRYLNRLSDLIYELARYETKDEAEETPVQGRKNS